MILMSQYLVAVIDGTRARFLTLEPAEFPEYQSGPNLVECESMSNATNDRPDQELWTDSKTGRNRGANGQAHSYDDHRDNHRVEFERRFAQEIVNCAHHLLQSYQIQNLVLVAEPQILGLMRDVLGSTIGRSVQTSELSKDLCHLKPHELHDYLANRKLLPPQKNVSRSR
jgi:protein required for attachment to host cells